MYLVILAILGGLVIWISKESSLLRNELFNSDNFCKLAALHKINNPRPSFSLGRSQLAFWTIIIVSSFIYLFLKCSTFQHFEVPVLNATNLGLLGIAMGTTLVSKTIDNSQKDTQGDAIPQQDYPSKGFFIDIISDEKGVSIHRLQNVIWTFVVGAIYIGFVSGHDVLPDDKLITTQLLSLMGISTGAYLGLKLNENKNVPVSDATTNEGPTLPTPPPAPPAPETNLSPSGDGNAPGGAPAAPVVQPPVVAPVVQPPAVDPVVQPPAADPIVQPPAADPVVEPPAADPVAEPPAADPAAANDAATAESTPVDPADPATGQPPADDAAEGVPPAPEPPAN